MAIKSPRTLGELADYTYKHCWAGTRSEDKTWINASKILDSLGVSRDVRKINKMDIDKMVHDFKSIGNAPSTINRKLAVLSKILTVGVELGVIDKKPAIKKLKESQGKIRWFTEDEQRLMIDTLVGLDHPDYAGVVRVLLDTGMRCGELFSLEWDDIHDNLIVLSKTKNYSPRTIPMTPVVQDIIEQYKEWVSPFGWGCYDHLLKSWNLMKVCLGWEDDKQATPHACRHTFITNLVQEGIDSLTVQRLAGHKSLAMTNRYTHLAAKDLEGVIHKLSLRRLG